MYLYYDKTGKLKEIINDEALRQGNYNANTIYVYVEEKQSSINYIRVNYLLPSDLIVGPQDYNTKESKMIPFDEKRDLEYFKYNTTYNFIKIVMEADENANGPLDMGGLVHCELRAFNLTNQQILKLGTLNFQVELDEVAQQRYIALLPQEYMSLSDYRYLELLIGNGIGYIKLNEGSGTLTDDELAMVNKDYCILEYDGNLYYKAGYNNLYAYFYRLNVWGTTGNREYRINDNFTITLADGSYSKLNSMQTFYNANVMDGLLPGYIELEDSGYVLTDDELAEAAKQYCVINLEGTYYYKAGETEYVHQFYKIPTMAGGSNDTIVFYNTYLPVTKSNGSWHTETSNFTTYKKDKIDTLLPGYIELTGDGGTLTAGQLLEVQKDYCVINLDDTLFYKAYENESIWQFYKIPEGSTNLLTDIATFSGKALPVSKGSGSWHWEGKTFTTYDKDKIDALTPGYIVLEQNSGTLTASELLEAAKNYCVIKFTDGSLTDSTRFYKVKETATDYIFAKEKTLTSNGTQTEVNFSEDWLEVDKSSGAYIITGGDLDYYTKKGVDELVNANKLYSHELTIEDNTHGWDYNITLLSPISTAFSNLTAMLTALRNEKAMFLAGSCMDNGEGEFYVMFGVHYTYTTHKLYCSVYNTTSPETTTILIDDSLDDIFEDNVTRWVE